MPESDVIEDPSQSEEGAGEASAHSDDLVVRRVLNASQLSRSFEFHASEFIAMLGAIGRRLSLQHAKVLRFFDEHPDAGNRSVVRLVTLEAVKGLLESIESSVERLDSSGMFGEYRKETESVCLQEIRATGSAATLQVQRSLDFFMLAYETAKMPLSMFEGGGCGVHGEDSKDVEYTSLFFESNAPKYPANADEITVSFYLSPTPSPIEAATCIELAWEVCGILGLERPRIARMQLGSLWVVLVERIRALVRRREVQEGGKRLLKDVYDSASRHAAQSEHSRAAASEAIARTEILEHELASLRDPELSELRKVKGLAEAVKAVEEAKQAKLRTQKMEQDRIESIGRRCAELASNGGELHLAIGVNGEWCSVVIRNGRIARMVQDEVAEWTKISDLPEQGEREGGVR